MTTLSPRTSNYKVKRGDTLWKIASEQYGDPQQWKKISQANNFNDPRKLLVGMTLKLSPIFLAGNAGGRPNIIPPKSALSQLGPPPPEASHAARSLLYPNFTVKSSDLYKGLKGLDVMVEGSPCKMDVTFDLVATRKGTIENVGVNAQGMDFTTYQKEAKQKFGKQIKEMKIQYEPAKNAFTVNLGVGATITDGKGNELLVTRVSFTPDEATYECTRDIKILSGDTEFKGQFGIKVVCKNNRKQDPLRQSSVVPSVLPDNWTTPRPLIIAGEVVLAGVVVTLIVVSIPEDILAATGVGIANLTVRFVEAARLFGPLVPASL